ACRVQRKQALLVERAMRDAEPDQTRNRGLLQRAAVTCHRDPAVLVLLAPCGETVPRQRLGCVLLRVRAKPVDALRLRQQSGASTQMVDQRALTHVARERTQAALGFHDRPLVMGVAAATLSAAGDDGVEKRSFSLSIGISMKR